MNQFNFNSDQEIKITSSRRIIFVSRDFIERILWNTLQDVNVWHNF